VKTKILRVSMIVWMGEFRIGSRSQLNIIPFLHFMPGSWVYQANLDAWFVRRHFGCQQVFAATKAGAREPRKTLRLCA